jgi:CRISPR-associated Csh1 family protein
VIKTIHDYGVHLRDAPETIHHFSIFSPPYSQRTVDGKVFCAKIQNKAFVELVEEPYNDSSEYLEKYIFREFSSNGAPVVPSFHFFYAEKTSEWEDSIAKFSSKLERCLKENQTLFSKYFIIKELLEKIGEALKKQTFPKAQNYFFTLKIEGKYLGEIPEIKALLETSAYDKYFRSKAVDKFCAVTYQDTPEVWGRVDTLGFTVNDIAFSRNGFNVKDSYKMFPVAPDAVKVLEGTMNLLQRELSFSFYNLRFFVLPHFVAIANLETRQKLTRAFYHATKMNAQEARENARTFTNLNRAIVSSETLFRAIAKEEQFNQADLYYDIFFYEQKQAQFAIKLHVSSVLPSRFDAILKAKKRIEDKYYLITVKTTKEGKKYMYLIRFATIKDFFSTKVKTELVYEPIFFKIIEAIFYKSQLDESQIVKAFLQKIVLAFKSISKEGSFAFEDAVKQSFCIHQFFQTLQLFNSMDSNTDKQRNVCLNAPDFVAQHPLFFPATDPLKQAAFYLGCATEVLFTAQRKRLDSEPFAKELNNLQLNYREMERLYTRLLAKAREYEQSEDIHANYSKHNGVLYDSYFYKLTYLFSVAFAQANPETDSKNAISFAYAIGLVMEKEFTRERVRIHNENKEQKEADAKAKKEG